MRGLKQPGLLIGESLPVLKTQPPQLSLLELGVGWMG